MRVVITGGGTGGHLYPGVAVLLKLIDSDPSAEVMYIGLSSDDLSDVERRYGIDISFEGLPLKGIAGKSPIEVLRAVVLFVRGVMRCRRMLKRFEASCVVGTGGFASAPACVAASMLRIPLILMEINYMPGLVTRRLSRRARAVAVSYPGTIELLPRRSRTIVTGTPVRPEIEGLADLDVRGQARSQALIEFGLSPDRKTLVVFGGSQGARALNRAVWEILPEIADRADIQILHLTGRGGGDDSRLASAADVISGKPVIYKTLAYTERMDLVYSAADLAVSRAGAGTVAELVAATVPAVLVPFPHATGGHQEMNARRLEEEGAARCVTQHGDSAEAALKEALLLLDEPVRLAEMRAAALRTGSSGASERIVRLIEELTRKRPDRQTMGNKS